MLSSLHLLTLAISLPFSSGIPLRLLPRQSGPIPSESSYYSDYRGKAAPFPANSTAPILPTVNGTAGPDDLLFQNLASAEWAVFSFYQQGVEAFNASSFTDIGRPNNTYDRIQEIRDAEAGHLRIFQDSISNASIAPGACEYDFGWTNASDFLSLQVLIEVVSMTFAAGLVQQAKTNITKGALMGVGETETRHAVWALIDVWNANPFAGPIDTTFPYANQILESTNRFIIPGSCPSANPIYPSPRQNLPQLEAGGGGMPGDNITFTYLDASNTPTFEEGQSYYAVFFHGVETISVPFDVQSSSSVIPAVLESKGVILAVIADEEGAPTEDSVIAGPVFLLQQPSELIAQT